MGNLVMLMIVEALIFCMVFILNKQDIMAPSVIVSLVFIFSTALALINGEKWNIDYNFDAFAILSMGLFMFGITDVVIANVLRRKRNVKQTLNPVHIERWKLWLIITLDLMVVLLVRMEVSRIAATNTWFTNIFYAYRVITSHSENIAADQYMNGIVNQAMKIVIVTGFMCAAFFVNNVLICKEKVKKNIFLLIPPILLCLMTLFTGVRTNILRLCVFCLICGYILQQYKKNWSIKTSWKYIGVMVIALIFVVLIFGNLQSVLGRTGSTDIISVISNYAGAPILHFNQYIKDPPAANEVFGQETFTGIWNVLYKLGITAQPYTAHKEYRYINATDYGNVYTMFRAFLQDFGVLGMMIMTSILSAFFSIIYNREIKYRTLTYKRWLVLIQYGYLYYIVAMASIDNIIQDYLNIGTVIMLILLHLMMWFMFRLKVRFCVRESRELR